jgi:hypothetical protein
MLPQISYALHASLTRALTTLATLLPAVLAFVLAVLASALIGALLAYALRRLLVALKVDERVRSSNELGILAWSSIRSPSLLFSQVVFWTFVVLGAVIGISAFAAAYSNSEHLEAVILPYVARCVGAALILLVGLIASRFLGRTALIGAVNMNLHYARLLSLGVKWMVLVLTFAMALDHLAIGGLIVDLAFGIIFGGIVLTLALAIGLGTPDLIRRSLDQDERPFAEETPTASVRHF